MGFDHAVRRELEVLKHRVTVSESKINFLTEQLQARSIDIQVLKQELSFVKSGAKLPSMDLSDESGLHDLRKELDQIRTVLMPGLPVKAQHS